MADSTPDMTSSEDSERLTLVIEATGVAIWDWQVQTGELSFNERWAEIIGYSLAELQPVQYETWASNVHPEDAILATEQLEKHWAGERALYEIEVRMKHKDGHYVWVLATGKTVEWQEDGKPKRMLGTHQDITERKRGEQNLAITNQLLQESQKIAKVGGWKLDLETGVLYWTDETYRLHDTSPEEFNPTVDAGVGYFLPDSRDRISQALEDAINHGIGYDLELETLTTKGRKIDVRTTCIVTQKNGVSVQLAGIFQDISDQKSVQRKLESANSSLEKSEQRLTLATDAAGIGVWDFNLDENKLIWDDQMYRLYGVEKDSFNGAFEAWTKGLHPDDQLMAEQVFTDAASGDGSFHTEFRVKHPDGEVRWIKADAWTKVDPLDGNRHLIGVNQDITDQKTADASLRDRQLQLEEAKHQAEKANLVKSEFLASMSHELRTPMTTVLGYTDLILEDAELPAATRQNCEKIKYATASLLDIINEILDMSKLESGKLELEYIDFDFGNFMKEVMSVFENKRAGDGEIDWQLHIDEAIPQGIHSDPTRLKQVMFNLIGNAQKFTEKGVIAVFCESKENPDGSSYLDISVKDTGIGLADDIIDQIFEPFGQADATTSRRFSGTGLGLPISKRIVEIMGGSIQATGNKGTGSTFSFNIPLIEAMGSLQDTKPVLTASSYTAVRPLKILFAEDNRVNQLLAAKVLGGYGHEISVVENGQEAIDAHIANDYDLILMDIRMPEVDGIEATQKIRALNGDKAKIPIIAVTADAMKDNVDSYLESGMDAFASKPFDWPRLLLTINKILHEVIHIQSEDD